MQESLSLISMSKGTDIVKGWGSFRLGLLLVTEGLGMDSGLQLGFVGAATAIES